MLGTSAVASITISSLELKKQNVTVSKSILFCLT